MIPRTFTISGLVNLLIILTSTLFTLFVLEFATRLYEAETLLLLKDYRGNVRDLHQEGLPAQYDASLGWIPRIGYSGTSNKWGTQVTILANGVRSNGHSDSPPQTPAILVVGDSFTFGDEVSDNETWPAILEELLGKRVINGGVFAYGTDQSFLRLKSLLPIYSPDTVIFSLIPDDLERAEYSMALGARKPYFEVQNNSLKLTSTLTGTVEHEQESLAHKIFGYSFLVHKIMMKINPGWWLTGRKWNEHHTGNSGEEITCLLFQQLGNIAHENQVSSIYVLIQDHKWLGMNKKANAQADNIVDCIDRDVIKLIDIRNDLSHIKDEAPDHFDSLFRSAHMSYSGNYFVARKIVDVMHGN